ncbi:PQQ-binding-like beta-propeller repeat protein [Natrinema caseinilyticum]|uniref:outer membrane protein assembly factor BamB family protein n=1 Tax=Natrinema caseinilyticum TaxID=2961570 RepID=UPI0020C4E306|nr:PQQ-binding-like beta-propeller repeat protein [Natrinema caseinilyticum]
MDGSLFANYDSSVYALDAATGDEAWQFAADEAITQPRIADGTVFVASDYTTVHALDTGIQNSSE